MKRRCGDRTRRLDTPEVTHTLWDDDVDDFDDEVDEDNDGCIKGFGVEANAASLPVRVHIELLFEFPLAEAVPLASEPRPTPACTTHVH